MADWSGTVRYLLRQTRRDFPGVRVISWHGEAGEEAAAVAGEEGVSIGEEKADVAIYFLPEGEFVPEREETAPYVTVVAKGVAGQPLPHLISHAEARRSVPLAEWVRGWGGERAARLLVSRAGAEKPVFARWPGHGEWIFARQEGKLRTRTLGEMCKYLLVTLGGAGTFPIMPATVASLFLLAPAYAIYALGGMAAVVAACFAVSLAATVGSVVLEKWAGRRFFSEDPREFVLDEVAGVAITWACLPLNAPWWGILLGFVLFRIFDIFKWGVEWVEKLPIRGRIVWDDLLAGFYAGVVAWLIVWQMN